MQGSLQVHPTDLLQRRIHLGDIVAFIEVWNKHARAKGGKSSRHLHAAVSYMVSRAQWGSAWGGSQSSNAAANPFEVTSPPSDGVTSLSFSPSAGASLLLASSWDSQQQVRIWEIGQRATVPKAATSLQQPVLCAAWSPDGTAVFAGKVLADGLIIHHLKSPWFFAARASSQNYYRIYSLKLQTSCAVPVQWCVHSSDQARTTSCSNNVY